MTLLRSIIAALAVWAGAASSASATPPVAGTPSLEAFAGHVTYVDFWASWCTPCAQSFPWLNTIQSRYGDRGLKVVGIGLDEDPTKGDRFLALHPASFATLRDPKGTLAERYGVAGMPYAVLLDEKGRVLHRHTGFRPEATEDYERAIEDALDSTGPHP